MLEATDKYMVPDYPICEQERERYRAYRRYLRELTEGEGFPQASLCSFNEFNQNCPI